jgi:hypothetical protein
LEFRKVNAWLRATPDVRPHKMSAKGWRKTADIADARG